MKHFKYLVPLVILMMVVTSLGLAGKNPGVVKTSASDQEGKFSILRPQIEKILNDEDLTKARMMKKNTTSRKVNSINRSAWKPTAKVQPVPPTSPFALGLAGTYTIPGSFPDIASAVAVLNFVGTTGAVTFELGAGLHAPLAGVTFTARSLSANPADNSLVTVQPAAGAGVVIQFQPSATEGKGFAFDGASNITIEGSNAGSSLILEYAGGTFPSGDAFAATIYVTGGSSDITVQNCDIRGQIVTAGTFEAQTEGRPAVFCYQDAGAANADITITSNTITNATYGLKVLSDYTVGYFQGPVTYSYNAVSNVSVGAIMDLGDGLHYDHNDISDVYFAEHYWNVGPTEYDGVATFGAASFLYDFGQPTGGHMYQSPNSTMNYNYVHGSYQNYDDGFAFIIYGLLNRISGSTTFVRNNRISDVHTTDANGTDAGIRTESGGQHNSISLSGVQGAGQTSYCYRGVAGDHYNNAFSNTRTGAAGSGIRVMQGTPSGISDGNAFYGTNGRITTASTVAGYFALGKDANSQWGPVGFDATLHLTAFPSSAEDIGRPAISVNPDIDGDVRDITAGGVRDAGADEVLVNSGSPTLTDVFPTAINPPIEAGEPFGLPIAMKVTIKNNSTTPTGAFDLTLTASDASGYSNIVSVSLASLERQTVTFPNWSPSAAGSWTLTATSAYVDAVDANAGNDVLARAQTVSTPTTLIGTNCFWTAGATGGWVGAGDFVFSAAFSKLGGPYAGTSWVTGAGAGSLYTNATAHTVTSPFYNLASLGGDGNVYISFYQSLETEPSWDRSWVQYTTDGSTWNNLGVLNDPNGVNWYSTGVYANAAGSNVSPDCWDGATAVSLGLAANTTDIPPAWTSNGDCNVGIPDGTPAGYVYTQLKITPANYPTVVGAGIIKFRFVAFADAGAHEAGWAIDNLCIAGTPPVLTTADFGGKVYDDADGSGTDNAMAPGAGLLGNGARTTFETGLAGVVVQMKYFGVLIGSDTTDGSGNYNFVDGLNAPGSYTFEVVTGLGVSDPAAGKYSANYTNDGIDQIGKNFGLYDGFISGTKFDDLNNDGINNDGGGFSGFVIEVHKDSCNGALVRTGTTGAGGTYSIPMPPGGWYVKEVPQAGYRQTAPAGNCVPVLVSGASGGPGAHQSGVDFGNFKLNTIKVQLFVDQNGNGVKEGPDINPLPGALFEASEFSKNGVVLYYDTLGRGAVNEIIHNNLDTGTYVSTQVINTPAGWVRTLGADAMNVTVTTSGASQNIVRMDYKLIGVSGVKFDDLNGNGVNDSEPGLAGWTINLSGTGGGSTVTAGGGLYAFADVGPGAHTLSEVAQAGWVATVPAGGTTNFTNNSGVDKTQDFGNFDSVCISGTKYRDRNNNGTMDAGEEGLAGWKINYGANSATTDANGNYSFCLGVGTDTLSEVGQAGYTQTEPALGYYVVARSSGTDVTGLNFGNFDQDDSACYRTWTVAELSGAGEIKPAKKPKVGKPVLVAPNTANLLEDLIKIKLQVLKVGLAGQLNAGGKEKAYLHPNKQKAAYESWNKKGVVHTGPGRGFDTDVKGKLLLKRFKSLPATKKNSCTIAELLALRLAVLSSLNLNTPFGLGALIINNGGTWDGQTIDQFLADMDNKMTNYEGQPFTIYDEACALAAAINAAFSTGSTTDTTATGGWFGGKLAWVATKYVIDVPFLKQGKNIPTPPPSPEGPPQLPTVFALNQNYPNPFNPTTIISFDLPEQAVVTLKIYNMLGQEVATLLNNEEVTAGTEDVEFDASSLSSGMYLYRLVASTVDDDGNVVTNNAFTSVKKMLLVK